MKPGMKATLTLMVVAGLVASLSGPANATPTCTTTINLPTGNGFVNDTALGAGVCVQTQDKIWGNFNFGNLTTTGNVGFNLTELGTLDRHQISFNNSFATNTLYTGISFEVAIAPGNPGVSILELDGDFTQSGTTGDSTLLKNSTPTGAPGSGINERKIGAVVQPGSVVSILYGTPGATDLVVTESLNVGADAAISSITDTVVEQTARKAPEPGSLLLLGAGLVGLGLIRRRAKSS